VPDVVVVTGSGVPESVFGRWDFLSPSPPQAISRAIIEAKRMG
jgi:hypothetical protein